MKKKIVATTLATGLVFSTTAFTAPINTYASPSQIIESNLEGTPEIPVELESPGYYLSRVYGELRNDEKAALRTLRDTIKNPTASWRNYVAIDSEYDHVRVAAQNLIEGFSLIIANQSPEDIDAQIDAFMQEYGHNFDVILEGAGSVVSREEIEEYVGLFITEFETNTNDISRFNSATSIEDLIFEYITTIKNREGNEGFSSFVETLQSKLGIETKVKLRQLVNAMDPNYAGRNALTKAIARLGIKSQVHGTGEVIAINGTKSLQVGAQQSYTYTVRNQSTSEVAIQDLLSLAGVPVELKWVSSNPSVATFDGNKLTARSAGTTTIQVVVGGNIVLEDATVTITGSTGGSIIIPPAPPVVVTPAPGALVPAIPTQAVETTPAVEVANGQSVVTVDTNAVLNQVNSNKEAKNIQIPVSGNSNVIVAKLDSNLITKVAENNENSLITLNTNLGTVSLPAKQLNAALAGKGENAQIEFKIEKAPASASNNATAIANANGGKLLSTPIVTNLVVVDGNARTNVSTFSSYVTTSLTIEGTLNANNVAVIEMLNNNQAAKDTGVSIAAVGSQKFAPVPAVVVTENGKTTITMKQLRNGTFAVVENSKTFSDVSKHWSKQQVELLASKFIVSGRDSGEFDPNGSITRAELATLIVGALGLTTVSSELNFKDVKSNDWFVGTVGAASKAGLIVGYNNEFRPNDKVTRQEAAIMLMNAVRFAGGKVEVTGKEQTDLLAKFGDKNEIDSWAKVEMAKAVKAKLLGGYNGELAPVDFSTRAEAAAMIVSFMESVGLINTETTK